LRAQALSMFEQSLPADTRPRDAIDAAHAFDEVAAALRELPGLIPKIRSFRCGPDIAVVAAFDSIDDQTIYRDHPEHQRMITDLIAPIRADRAAVQYDSAGSAVELRSWRSTHTRSTT
jgi:hypothetical protein